LFRIGIPVFDRLGAGQQVSVGYRGARNLIFEVGNLLAANVVEPTPEAWLPKHQQSHDLVTLQLVQ
jgi:nitrogenase molybdenum-iron protein NifN